MRAEKAQAVLKVENTSHLHSLQTSYRKNIWEVDIEVFLSRYQEILIAENDPDKGLVAKHYHGDSNRLFHKLIITGEMTNESIIMISNLHFDEVDFSKLIVLRGQLQFENCTFTDCVDHGQFCDNEFASYTETLNSSTIYPFHSASGRNSRQGFFDKPSATSKSNPLTDEYLPLTEEFLRQHTLIEELNEAGWAGTSSHESSIGKLSQTQKQLEWSLPVFGCNNDGTDPTLETESSSPSLKC